MQLNIVYSIIGLCGGIVCAIGDILLDLKGKDNVKVGGSLLIESNWVKMASWRFKLSIIFGFLGSFMYSLGIYSLGRQLLGINGTLAEVMVLFAFITAMSGFFVHSLICLAPILYKAILGGAGEKAAELSVNTLLDAIKILFGILYAFIMLAPTALTIYCIATGLFNVPMWFVLLNPVVFLIVGVVLRKIKRDWFYDLPSICMPSLGIGMFGVIGIVNLL